MGYFYIRRRLCYAISRSIMLYFSGEFGQVKSLLDKIKSSTSTKPALFSLFCDELSVGLTKAPTDLKVVKLIMDDFMSIFQVCTEYLMVKLIG